MGDKANRTLEHIRPLSVTLEDHFYEVTINLNVGNCRGLVNSEGAVDGSGADSEAGHELE